MSIETTLTEIRDQQKQTNELLEKMLGRREPELRSLSKAAVAVDLNRVTLAKLVREMKCTPYGTGRTVRYDVNEIRQKLAAAGRPSLRAVGGR